MELVGTLACYRWGLWNGICIIGEGSNLLDKDEMKIAAHIAKTAMNCEMIDEIWVAFHDWYSAWEYNIGYKQIYDKKAEQ